MNRIYSLMNENNPFALVVGCVIGPVVGALMWAYMAGWIF